MSTVLFVGAMLLLCCGYIFAFALDRRRKKIFDDRCTAYLIISAASFITSATLCLVLLGLKIFGVW